MNDPREIEFGDDATALYRLYDTDGHLLYVGITFSPAGRMAHHAANQEWWGDVARKTMVWYPTRDDASAAEAAAIQGEHPQHNKKHNKQTPSRSNPRSRVVWPERDLAERYDAGEWTELVPGRLVRQLRTAENAAFGNSH